MTGAVGTNYVAECFWPGVAVTDLHALDLRIEACAAGSAGPAGTVRYLGSMLIVDDEVVLCVFEGPLDAVRGVAECAEVPYERLLRSTLPPWPLPAAPAPLD